MVKKKISLNMLPAVEKGVAWEHYYFYSLKYNDNLRGMNNGVNTFLKYKLEDSGLSNSLNFEEFFK